MSDYRNSRSRRTTRSAEEYYIEGNTIRRTYTDNRRRRASGSAYRDVRRTRSERYTDDTRRARYGRPARSASTVARTRRTHPQAYAPDRRRRSTRTVEQRALRVGGRQRKAANRGGISRRQRRLILRIAKGNREKAERMSLGYTLFLCIALLAALASCVIYLSAQSAVTQKNEEVISLKSELNLLVETNSQTKERINDSIDLEYVRKYATDVLGMVYPAESQIVKYHSDDEDYIKQYQDIPQTGE